jgi:hypothetical protein
VKSGESVELAPTAKVKLVEVLSGGSLDVEGASTAAIKSNGAVVMRICAASISAAVRIVGSSGPVVIGEGNGGCSSNTFATGVTLQGNTGGVLVDKNLVKGSLKDSGGSGGTTITNNTVSKALTVTGNSGVVTDGPNTVGGKSKIQ